MRRTLRLPAILIALAAATPGDALAQRLRVRVGPESPYSECYCRAKGRLFAVGETVCLSVGQGPRQATCGMDQNVTSWRFSDATCPES